MRFIQTPYFKLFAGLMAFYAIMTFDQDKLNAGNLVAWIKIGVGLVALLYLLINGYQKIQREARTDRTFHK